MGGWVGGWCPPRLLLPWPRLPCLPAAAELTTSPLCPAPPAFCSHPRPQVRTKIIVGGRLNADIVGQSVQRLAEIFDISVPAWAKVLIAEVGGWMVLV